MKDRSHWRIYIGDIENAPTSWDDWKNKSYAERFEATQNIIREHHNGQAGINARLERVIRIIDRE